MAFLSKKLESVEENKRIDSIPFVVRTHDEMALPNEAQFTVWANDTLRGAVAAGAPRRRTRGARGARGGGPVSGARRPCPG